MFSMEATIALIMMEILLLVGFLGIFIVIIRFNAQIKENIDSSTEVLISEIRKAKDEAAFCREELAAYYRIQKENNKDSSK